MNSLLDGQEEITTLQFLKLHSLLVQLFQKLRLHLGRGDTDTVTYVREVLTLFNVEDPRVSEIEKYSDTISLVDVHRLLNDTISETGTLSYAKIQDSKKLFSILLRTFNVTLRSRQAATLFGMVLYKYPFRDPIETTRQLLELLQDVQGDISRETVTEKLTQTRFEMTYQTLMGFPFFYKVERTQTYYIPPFIQLWAILFRSSRGNNVWQEPGEIGRDYFNNMTSFVHYILKDPQQVISIL